MFQADGFNIRIRSIHVLLIKGLGVRCGTIQRVREHERGVIGCLSEGPWLGVIIDGKGSIFILHVVCRNVCVRGVCKGLCNFGTVRRHDCVLTVPLIEL